MSLLQSLLNNCNDKFVLERFQLIPYNIKLNQAWTSASLSLQYRQGFLVRLFTTQATTQGISFTGDCAPIPEMGTETLFQAQTILHETLSNNTGKIISEAWLSQLELYPASRFALESAILTLICHNKKQNLAQLLNPDYQKTIQVNSMLGSLNSVSIQTLNEAEKQGFKCHKFKFGLQPVESEAEHLTKLLKVIKPDSKIRLDCNKSWSFEQAKWFIDFINTRLSRYSHQIDGLEEPLTDYNYNNYHSLQQLLQEQSTIRLALDESLPLIKQLDKLPVKRIILKPTLSGGIIKTWQLAQKAQSLGIEVIVTSAIETAYGLWPITYLTAAIANNQYHGLATAAWLEDSLIKAPEIKHGTITL